MPRGFACIDECRWGLVYVGRASRIVPLVFRRSAGLDDHQAGSGVAVPAERPAGDDRVLHDIEVRGSLRVDDYLPEVGRNARIDVRPREDADVGEGAISNSYRCYARLGRCESRGDGDERQCDEKWQNWYFFELSQRIHCFSLLCFSPAISRIS